MAQREILQQAHEKNIIHSKMHSCATQIIRYSPHESHKKMQTIPALSYSLTQLNRLKGALVHWLVLLGGGRAVDQESGHLHLANGIEGHEADVGIRESDGALADLGQDLGAITAAKHGELPHGPVAVVKVVDGDSAHAASAVGADVCRLGGRELEARGPAVADNVVHLLGDLLVGQGGQVGEGLEEPEQHQTTMHESFNRTGHALTIQLFMLIYCFCVIKKKITLTCC